MDYVKGRKLLDYEEDVVKYCSDYLCEKWSRSDEIDGVVSLVYSKIEETLGNATENKIEKGLSLYVGDFECEMWCEKVNVEYYVYNADSDEIIYNAIQNAFSRNGYDEETKEMIITIYLSNGEVIEPVSTKNISHEVEHILQIQYSKKNNKNYKLLNRDEYKYASEIIDNEKAPQIAKKIAWLFYYSNRHEQDALMNEYYEDLRHNRQFIIDKNSEIHSRLFSYEHLAEWCKLCNTEEFNNELNVYRRFGYNRTAFFTMVDKGLKRFKKKMKNVEKHFENRVSQLNEQRRHYTEKNIGRIRSIKISRN